VLVALAARPTQLVIDTHWNAGNELECANQRRTAGGNDHEGFGYHAIYNGPFAANVSLGLEPMGPLH
jgi:hypothetical protein